MDLSHLYEFSIFVFFLGLSAFYSASEAALVSMSIDRTKQLIEEGGPKGKALEFMAIHSNDLLATILLGNNFANIFLATYAGSLTEDYFQEDGLAISVSITTFLILIFGEIIPKTFARVRNEILIVPCIRILQANFYLFYPVVYAVTFFIRKILGKNAELSARFVTLDDIEFMVSKAEKEKSVDSKQLDLLSSVLEFPTLKVKDIMVSRGQISFIKKSDDAKYLREYLKETGHSRYPVVDGDLDHTVGLLHVKDLIFKSTDKDILEDITQHLREPLYIYEHMKLQAAFDYMNRKKVHLAMVKDENGIVVGIVTFEDIFEEIFGEIQDEHDTDEAVIVKYHEGVVIPGSTSLRDLYSHYDIKIPLSDNYSTINGFLLDKMGSTVPKKSMILFWQDLSFHILHVDDGEIKKVRIKDIGGDNHVFAKPTSKKKKPTDPASTT
jgi:putative hemolysin